MTHPRTTIFCALLALAGATSLPAAGAAGPTTAAAAPHGGCTGLQDRRVTPELFRRCLAGDHASPAGGPAPARMELASAAAAPPTPAAKGPNGNRMAALITQDLPRSGAAEPPAGDPPYPVPGLADAPLHLIDLQPVHFVRDKADLSDEAQQALGRIARYLQRQRGLRRVVVIGYADSPGSRSHNYRVSAKRTKAVRDFLVAQGVAPGLFHTTARGRQMPVDEGWLPEGRKRNRRVELYAVVR